MNMKWKNIFIKVAKVILQMIEIICEYTNINYRIKNNFKMKKLY